MPVAWRFFAQRESVLRGRQQPCKPGKSQNADKKSQEGIPCCLPALRDNKTGLFGEKRACMPSPTCKLSAFAVHATEFVWQRFIYMKAAFITGRAFRILDSTDSAVEET